MPRHLLSEIFSTNIRSVAPNTGVIDALRLMCNENISCLPVVFNHTPVGILTERDLLRATDKILAGRKLEVRDLMSRPVLMIDHSETLDDALFILRENKIRHLIVSDDGVTIHGVLTLSDILKTIAANCYFSHATVDKIMAKNVSTLKRDTSLMRVLHEMADKNLSCIIIEENHQPQGIITERDLVWLLTEKPQFWSSKAEDVMSMPVTTLTANRSPHDAVAVMTQENIRHIVVVNKDGIIAGLLTQSLLCRELSCPSETAANLSSI